MFIIAAGGKAYVQRNGTDQSGSKPRMPEWFEQPTNRRSTMTKSLILATVIALGLSSGAAMAQEADAQNLFSGLPHVNGKDPAFLAPIAPALRSYSVQSQNLIAAPDGADGGGH
jgi:hypothetical protein